MTIALAKDVEDYLSEQVKHGVCSDASELVNDLVRSLRGQQRHPLAVTPEMEAWLLETPDQPSTSLTSCDFSSIRERVRTRHAE